MASSGVMDADLANLVEEQKAYYRARAPEYEDWWHRTGPYAADTGTSTAWFPEVAALEAWVFGLAPFGRTLELACGTGLWTRHLASRSESVLAVDASPETIAINRARVEDGRVDYLEADLFGLEPPGRFDTVFMGFWLSHVPDRLWDGFWDFVRRCLVPGGRAIFVDTYEISSKWQHKLVVGPTGDRIDYRSLGGVSGAGDWRVVKHRFDADIVTRWIERAGFKAEVATTNRFFVHGIARP